MAHSNFDTFWQSTATHTKTNDEIIEHGWEQHVILDHANQLVYRYPRTQAAADKLADEVDLLSALHTQSWPIAIPTMRELTKHFAVYDLIEGDVLTPEKLRSINEAQITAIGHKLGTFLARLHNVSPDIVEKKKTKQTMTLLEYYTKRINHSKQSEHVEAAQEDLLKLQSDEYAKQVVVHGDLHGLNMVISPTSKTLVGVIDFSEVELGDPHQDFRKLFMTDERLLLPALERYANASGRSLSSERIKTWAFVNEWANVCYFTDKPAHPTYQRALTHLKAWGKL